MENEEAYLSHSDVTCYDGVMTIMLFRHLP